MRKTMPYVLFASLLALATAAYCLWRSAHGLSTAEEAYYNSRIHEIIGAWQNMGYYAGYGPDGQPRESRDVYLVIDARRGAICIEDHGQVLEEHHSELPAQLTWTVYQDVGNGIKPLGSLVRLKYRGPELDLHYPELLWLIGRRGREYQAFYFSGKTRGAYRVSGGSFKACQNAPARKEGVSYYDSIVVSSKEYEQSRLAWVGDNQPRTSTSESPPIGVSANKAAWLKVSKRLYQTMESQVSRAGFRIDSVTVTPGSDYSAASAEVFARQKSTVFQRLRHSSRSARAYLKIDYLGQGIWYARSAPDPRRAPGPIMGEEALELEFLVSAGEPVQPADQAAWLEKGRGTPDRSVAPPTRSQAELTNGVVVEFLGLCEYPTADRQWWGPDGSRIDHTLLFHEMPPVRNVGDGRVFEIVWRVYWPSGAQEMSTDYTLEGGRACGIWEERDDHDLGQFDLVRVSRLFEKSQEKTTLTIDADVDRQGPRIVKFKNISLVPGKDQGFETEVVK